MDLVCTHLKNETVYVNGHGYPVDAEGRITVAIDDADRAQLLSGSGWKEAQPRPKVADAKPKGKASDEHDEAARADTPSSTKRRGIGEKE